jgi:hypothetical protein
MMQGVARIVDVVERFNFCDAIYPFPAEDCRNDDAKMLVPEENKAKSK